MFLITDKLLDDGFTRHVRLLGNSELCGKENSLLYLQKPSHRRRIPLHIRDLTLKELGGVICAKSIAKEIIEYVRQYDLTIDAGELASNCVLFLLKSKTH